MSEKIEPTEVPNNIQLSKDAEAELVQANIDTAKTYQRYRELDHELWNHREQRKADADLERTANYNRHVKETNWHNRITTVLFLLVIVVLIRVIAGL